MQLQNTTDIPNDLVREIIRFVRPPGIRHFDVVVKNGRRWGGRAYYNGSGYHSRWVPFIAVRIPRKLKALKHHAYGHQGVPIFWTWDRIEAVVAIIAHELRHLWQSKQRTRRGYFPRTRGKFSERDCECWALNRLRAWRKKGLPDD